ncbi:hypothetical protein [Nocardia stercoris]|uniref:hypothetical protein n=1 Tax=Nocardia stercoris TaxID=2483361 RepID=UPI00131A1857|nr:hypothetical protein [Nocardia stercoris]
MARRLMVLLAMVAGVSMLLAGPAAAGPVTLHDDSHVLDAGKVTQAGNALPDPVQIFTTELNATDNAAFDSEATKHVTGATDVVIAINTKSHHLAIRTGGNSHIKDTAPASTAFKNAYGNGDYTGATVAALQSLTTAYGQGAPTPAPNRQPAPAPAHNNSGHSGFSLWSLLCPLILIGGIAAAVFAVIRRRRQGGGGFPTGGGMPGGGMPGGYGTGGGYPGGYPGGGYPQGGRGMSPGMAGGLGAAAGAVGGGLLGYELGKLEGEREADRGGYDGGYDGGNQGSYDGGGYTPDYGGGGSDSDFGGGSDGGFDGGGFDGGSSSDF